MGNVNKVPPFLDSSIESLAKVMGECGTGGDISGILARRNIVDQSGVSTKWRRLHWVFLDIQRRDKCANRIIDFIRAILAPARFVGKTDKFEAHRSQLNVLLALSGLEYGADGEFRQSEVAATLTEAERRASTVQRKFQGRRLHPEVLKYCRAELMQNNYFHAVFEATKGLAQRIRDKAGVDGDGVALVNHVFLSDSPILAFNTLRTQTERSEQRGVAELLKGCFSAVRNPLAHEPKILWDGEDDAADYFTLISLLHRKLDNCWPTGSRSGS